MVNSKNLADSILATLKRYENSVLISDDSEVWTGSEIFKKAVHLGRLIESACPIGAPIIVSFPNSSVNAITVLAVMLAERVPVIISPQDFSAEPESWLKRVKPALVFADREYKVFRSSFSAPPLFVLNFSSNVESTVSPNFAIESRDFHSVPAGTALVLFTSGSTGTPKGICVPASGVEATAQELITRFSITSKTISPIVLPICHSMGLNTHFLPTFFAGGRSHFVDIHLELAKLYRTILNSQGSVVSLIGEILMCCHKEKEKRNLPEALLVKHVQLAGGMITEHHLRIARELFPNAIIHKGYGLTEGIRVTMIDDRDPDFLSDSVGDALSFTTVEIRGEGKKTITSPYQIGEIWIKGANTYLGVLGEARARDSTQFFASGDLGYWNSRQQLCIAGRDDGLFKFNGNRVSGSEIEKIARETSASIRNAKCLLIEDEKTGRKKIALFLEISSLDYAAVLERKLGNRLQHLTHPPKQLVFLSKFPTTSNGKVSLSKLKNFQNNLEEELIPHVVNLNVPDRTVDV